ncbi:hypothetical protein [Aquimarina sp. I32.4]|uniref:hypothetical protein n=1 Tax=Aquimarina sp. I32.4 TaxID=2053903 RepID=UPI000CDE8936|nr:hypothetical protein [Aquimarina sp. I32.4]
MSRTQLNKTILSILLLIFLVGCFDFKINYETFYITLEEEDNLEILDPIKIAKLIDEPSVGRNVKIEGKNYFLPVNFDYHVSNVGKYRMPIGDLIITNEVNKYQPIRFNYEKDHSFRSGGGRNTFLFFLPSEDENAITKKKILKQYSHIDYIDNNSLISKSTVISYQYLEHKKGFEIFHSVKIPYLKDVTLNESLYESVDVLRMAKHLKDTTSVEFNWEKIDYVTPPYFHRYFTEKVLDTIVMNTKKQPNNFKYNYKPDKLQLELSFVKDSALAILFKDLERTPLNKDFDIEKNYSKESLRILADYLSYFDYEILISKKNANTFYFKDGFSYLVLHFNPKKELLFIIKEDSTFNEYNYEIYFHFFNKNLIPKLDI